MISVMVVEDQTLVREGLVRLLEFSSSIKVVGCASSGETALPLIEQLRPDVILVDIQMPAMDGFSLITRVRQQCSQTRPHPRCIVLTTFDDDRHIESALQVGAQGFLLKDASLTQLVSAIEKVAHGENAFPARASKMPPSAKPADALTSREQDILRHMTTGLSNKEIARVLQLSEGTVKNHVSNILAKLGVRDRTQAVISHIRIGQDQKALGDQATSTVQ